MNPFDFVNSINSTKKDLMRDDPTTERLYTPFVVNRSLSYFPDTVAYAQAMNCNHHIDNLLQYHYLLNSIRPSKRFSKWAKKEESGDLEVVKQYYGYSNEKAIQALRVLTEQQLEQIKQRLERGGDEKSRHTSGGAAKAG